MKIGDAEIEPFIHADGAGIGGIKDRADDNDSNKRDNTSNDNFNHEWAKKRFAIHFCFAFDGNLIEIRLIIHKGIIT